MIPLVIVGFLVIVVMMVVLFFNITGGKDGDKI